MAKFDVKTRRWTFVVYPESQKVGWIETLNETNVAVIISPLHLDSDGEKLVKPHHHVMVEFANPVRFDYVCQLVSVVGVSYVEPVRDFVRMCRYFCHLDEPSDSPKAKYPISDVVVLNGAKFKWELPMDADDLREMRKEIIGFVNEQGWVEYSVLADYVIRERIEWFPDVHRQSIFWRAYFASKRNMARDRDA